MMNCKLKHKLMINEEGKKARAKGNILRTHRSPQEPEEEVQSGKKKIRGGTDSGG